MLSPNNDRVVYVTDPHGLHLRPCSAIVSAAGRFRAVVTVKKDRQVALAASIFDLLSLAATQGTRLVVSAAGPEAPEALEAVAELFSSEPELAHCA